MTDDELAAIEVRAAAATPGPWVVSPELRGYEMGIDSPAKWGTIVHPGAEGDGGIDSNADANFIAHARADVPALIAAVRELKSDVEYLQGCIRDELGPQVRFPE